MASGSSTRYTAEPLINFAAAAFEHAGMRRDDARVAAVSIVSADLRGVTTHGMVRLSAYVKNLKDGTVRASAQPELMQDGAGIAVVHGQNGMGQVVAGRCMELAIERARRVGVAAVTARNSNHFGTCAYWAMMAADAGMIGLATTNSSPAMAPWGGLEMLIGNNPLAIAAPSDDPFPVVLDMAMTVVARGRVRLAQMNGEEIPLGWGLDQHGQATRNPADALAGSLVPVGGYKGYGLAVMVDLLTAALSGAALSPQVANMGFTAGQTETESAVGSEPGIGTGHFFLALDIQQFLPVDVFKRRVSGYVALLHAARRVDGANAIYVPGELEWRAAQDRRTRGIEYDARLIAEWQTLASEADVPMPEPFEAR